MSEGNQVGPDFIIERTCELLRTNPPNKVTRIMAARACEIHPSLIHYYFKTRASLMFAAVRKLSAEFRARIDARLGTHTGTPAERLRARVETLVELEMKYPYFHRLLVEEVLASDEPEAIELAQGLALRGITSYSAMIQEGVAHGDLREVDGGWLFTSIISLCQFFDKAKILYRAFAHPETTDEQLEASYRRFVVNLMMDSVIVQES